MIALLRLDERMIHGQIAIKWSRHLSVDRIIVVSEAAAASEVVQKSLMMAAPPTAKVAIKGLEDALKLILDPRMGEHNLMIIASTLDELQELVRRVPGIPLVNVGNYGRLAAKKEGEARKMLAHNLFLYPEEISQMKEIVALGVKCNYQTTPEDGPVELKKLLEG